MIKLAKESGADCVKFQKSYLPAKFNKNALMWPYEGKNSWGKTYGEHKTFLEFSETEYTILQKYSAENEILFTASAMDEVSLHFLDSINVPFIKIGSGDFHNKFVLKSAAYLQKPLIISTGMSNMTEVTDVYNFMKEIHSKFCLLHCVSSYPTPYDEINLNVIKTYKKTFPDINIGYSGHELGIDVSLAAVMLGAKVIERHFTLDKSWKGSDHCCSLLPNEFKKLVENVRLFESGQDEFNEIWKLDSVQKALGSYEKKFQQSEKFCFDKLGKTLVAAVDLKAGDFIKEENVAIKVAEPKGIPGKMLNSILNKTLKRNVKKDESIFESDLF